MGAFVWPVVAGGGWERDTILDLRGLSGGALVDGDGFLVGDYAMTFNQVGASVTVTREAAGIRFARSTTGDSRNYLHVALAGLAPSFLYAVLLELAAANIGGLNNVGGFVGRVLQTGLGPGWEGGIRSADRYVRGWPNSGPFTTRAITGSAPAAPVVCGAVWSPELGICTQAAAGSELPGSPLVGQATGPGMSFEVAISQFVPFADRIGASLNAFGAEAFDVTIARMALYRLRAQ